jgi:hypothetical protein
MPSQWLAPGTFRLTFSSPLVYEMRRCVNCSRVFLPGDLVDIPEDGSVVHVTCEPWDL